MIQVTVVATYFLSAVAKVREGGWLWGSSATLIWALTRREAWPASWLATQPPLTYVLQWLAFVMEALSPLMLWLRGRPLYLFVGFWVLFHPSTYVLLTIHFLPTAVCLLAFLPLERVTARRLATAEAPVTASAL